jgi:CRISPR-associated protein Csd1
MLVQALAAYADEYLSEELAEDAWEEKPVPALIEIGHDGTFLGIVPRLRQETPGKKTVTLPQLLQIPKSPVNRNNGLHPLLAADYIKYVLGPGAWTAPKDEQNAIDLHEAFVGLIRKAAALTNDRALEACAFFYDRGDQVQAAREALKDSKPATLIALSVDGPLVAKARPRSFWNEHYRVAYEQRMDTGGVGECIISGRFGAIAPTHPKIKGTANVQGRAEVSLMSFDKPAFRSYNWEKNENSPVSPERSMAYVLALNDLLRSDNRRRDVAGVAFIYWTKKRCDFDPMANVEQASHEQVSALLRFDPGADPDPNMFYMAGIAGNGARLLVRYWVAETLATAKANLKGWFEGLRIIAPDGEPAPSPRLWQLRFAIDRNGKPKASQALALIRRAIEGQSRPLGYDILNAVLARLRHPPESKSSGQEIQPDRFAPARMGLLRLCLNDIFKGEMKMTESLDPNQDHPAYVCGRLLAEYENLQETAYRKADEAKVNITVADRYYSLASTNPAIAFPKIEALSRSHFRKLRRHDTTGAAKAIERSVIELHAKLGTHFPLLLSLDEQGRFALGYYHQKAEKSRRIAEHEEKKAASGASPKEQE